MTAAMPADRPLLFVRVRLYRGGQAETIRDILRDEQQALLDDLAKLRRKGRPEDDEEVVQIKQQLVHVVNFLRDVDQGLSSLVGATHDEDPLWERTLQDLRGGR